MAELLKEPGLGMAYLSLEPQDQLGTARSHFSQKRYVSSPQGDGRPATCPEINISIHTGHSNDDSKET
ncbi:hypothetical protein FRC00_000377, partial [Tulasnella sp. 408]